jgi:hypothetical protein
MAGSSRTGAQRFMIAATAGSRKGLYICLAAMWNSARVAVGRRFLVTASMKTDRVQVRTHAVSLVLCRENGHASLLQRNRLG